MWCGGAAALVRAESESLRKPSHTLRQDNKHTRLLFLAHSTRACTLYAACVCVHAVFHFLCPSSSASLLSHTHLSQLALFTRFHFPRSRVRRSAVGSSAPSCLLSRACSSDGLCKGRKLCARLLAHLPLVLVITRHTLSCNLFSRPLHTLVFSPPAGAADARTSFSSLPLNLSPTQLESHNGRLLLARYCNGKKTEREG